MNYENGVLIAFFIWLFQSVFALISPLSQRSRNLKKVGYKTSLITGQLREIDASDLHRPVWKSAIKFLFVTTLGLAAIFLSWVQVAFFFANFVYRFAKDTGAPPEVKEFRWRLKNVDMDRDQIIELIAKAKGVDISEQPAFKEEFLSSMEERGLL